MDAEVQLPSYCPACGHAVDVIYTPSDADRMSLWYCPNDGCHAVQTMTLKGSIVRAIRRHEPPPGPSVIP